MPEALPLEKALPADGKTRQTPGWWGLWTLVLTEGSLFGYLLMTYFYLYFQKPAPWPPDGLPKLLVPGINTAVLLSSSAGVYLAERLIRMGRPRLSLVPQVTAIALGLTFVLIQLKEWHDKPFGLNSDLYGSLFFTITGFHMLHVVVGLIVLSTLMVWTAMGYFRRGRSTAMTLGGLYWHFVDVVWLFVFASLYLSPHIIGR